jgi:protocatechuate 3,4-dioxygenase beta subunit
MGLIAATLAIGSFGLTPPAHAATPGSIAGTLTNSGSPVAGVSVYVESDVNGGGSATTDSTGHYAVAGLEPGQYRVHFVPADHPDQYAYGKATYETANIITVTSGVQTTVNDKLLATGTISGTLSDSHGAPVAGAQVSAFGSGGSGYAFTSSNGSYSMSVLPGTYKISFLVGGIEQYAHGKTYDTADVFTVTATTTTTINETLIPAGTIAGHVTRSDGTPASFVEVDPLDVNGGNGNYSYITTDETGAYRLDYLKPGDYKIQFRLPSGATQLAPDARSLAAAQTISVNADATATMDESLLPTGSLAGRLTTQAGAGIANAQVGISSRLDSEYLYTETDANGDYRLDDVFADTDYKVHFTEYDSHVDQWAFGKLTREAADPITVTAGQTATVNDKKLPGGSVKVTAKDSVTGATISTFSAWVGEFGGQTTTGTLTIADVTASVQDVIVTSAGYSSRTSTVTVIAGQQTSITVTLVPKAKLLVKVVDRVTGTPLSGVVVLSMQRQGFVMPDGIGERTAADGTLTVEIGEAGTYQLFVFPKTGSGFGAQWVGATGGTGDQQKAQSFTVSNGQTVAVPTIKLDKAGTIKGKVTSTTGTPVMYGAVTMAPQAYHSGGHFGEVPVAADGSYTIDFLGPYTWPLLFSAQGHAMQWSDGTAYRYHPQQTLPRRTSTAGTVTTSGAVTGTNTSADAPVTAPTVSDLTGPPRRSTFSGSTNEITPVVPTATTTATTTTTTTTPPRRTGTFAGVKVTSGQTTTFNYTMRVGTKVTVIPSNATGYGFIDVYNAVTGDFLGSEWADDLAQGTTLRVLGNTQVTFLVIDDTFRWCGGSDFSHATTYTVPISGTPVFSCSLG